MTRRLATFALLLATTFASTVFSGSPAQAECLTVPGDVNADGKTNVVDTQCTLLTVLYQLTGAVGAPPGCLKGQSPLAADVNCTGQIDVVDVQVTIALILTGKLPPAVDSDQNACVDNCEAPSDQAPPVITITSPLPETLLSAPALITVTGTVADDSSVTVKVKGITATILPNGTWQADNVPLVEGQNTLTATATDQWDNSATATVLVRLDTTAPIITIETPPDGTVVASVQVDVAGLVNDIVEGTTIQADDVTVTVNGVQAMVANRAWVVPGLLLQPGPNRVVATASDAMGNSKSVEIGVVVDNEAGQKLVMVSGNAQTGPRGSELPLPMVVALPDAKGDPIEGRDVVFEVVRGDGKLIVPTVPPSLGTSVTVTSDDDGLAQVRFVLGQRAGGGNHRVRATAPGFVGFVEYCFAADTTTGTRITSEMGNGQAGAVGQPLPMPFSVLVTDAGGNCVDGTEVTFTVVAGGGNIGGQQSVTVPASSDGMASVYLTLGPDVGVRNNIVQANIAGNTEGPAPFTASGLEPGLAFNTSVSGVVLTNEDVPMPNVWAFIKGTSLQAFTDAEGRFTIDHVPVGSIHLHITGATTPLPGTWPDLEYEIHTVAGQDNTVGMPIYLPQLDMPNKRLVGGPEDVTIVQNGMPGASLTVFADSVTCPDGSKTCEVSWSQVNMERVPMPAPMGSAFMLAWTVQPSGTHFDPPARICIPNMDMPAGMQTEIYSFDHDLEAWVAVGTATITADGKLMCSDPGFGVVKAGWGGCVPPPPPKKCPSNCDDGNDCTSDSCENGACKHTPRSGACKDDGNKCTDDVCQGGACTHPPTNEGGKCDDGNEQCGEAKCQAGACKYDNQAKEGQPCDDEKLCTDEDKCQSGTCKGEPVKYADFLITPINYNVTKFIDIVNKGLDLSKPIVKFTPFKAPEVSVNFGVGEKKECCEKEQIKEAKGGQVKGGVKVGVKTSFLVATWPPLPPVVADYFGVGLNVELAIALNASGTGGKKPCTQEEEFKLNGSISGDITLTIQGVIVHPSVIKVYGGARTGLSGNVECVNTAGSAYLKWNGVTIVCGYTVAGFIDKNVTIDWIKGQKLGDGINFSCEVPEF
jgi:hypothetical protein